MAGVFITATGTEIGKTYVTCNLLQWDNAQQKILTASKPVMSGWPQSNEAIHTTDSSLLLTAQKQACTPEALNKITPWRFNAPLTPEMAAQQENKKIDPAYIIAHSQQLLETAKQQRKIHLIEGVGGIMSPIAQHFTGLEWLQRLSCPCIVVSGSYLGALSHTLTAIKVLQSHAIKVLALVVNETVGSSVSFAKTAESLQSFLPHITLISISYRKNVPLNTDIAPLYQSILQYFSMNKKGN